MESELEEIVNGSYSSSENTYPYFESDSKVVLAYKGKVDKVDFLSDITGWTNPIPFIKAENDIFYLKLELETDARLQYMLVVDGNTITDPLNKYQIRHGLGAMSELAMPHYQRHPYFESYLYGEQGSFAGLIKNILRAGVLPYDHEVYIYLPPNYNDRADFPVIYFQDGPDYIRFGLAPHSINRLIIDNKIEPCIAVFVTPPNLHMPLEPNRSTEYGLNDDYVKFFCDELVPYIDSNYRTKVSSLDRLIVGDSYAGLISFYIALSRTDLFVNVYSQSGYFSFKNNKLIDLVKNKPLEPLKLFLDIGTYEEVVGADFLPSNEQDFLKGNREMREVLTSKKYLFVYKEYHEGHTWGNWRSHLIDALIYFFGAKGVQK